MLDGVGGIMFELMRSSGHVLPSLKSPRLFIMSHVSSHQVANDTPMVCDAAPSPGFQVFSSGTIDVILRLCNQSVLFKKTPL